MPNYRRAFIPGGCWFFTVTLLDRRESLLVEHVDVLRKAVVGTRQERPFTIDAFVVLPDHLGAVSDWPHSSFHRDVRRGIFPSDWAGKIEDGVSFGER